MQAQIEKKATRDSHRDLENIARQLKKSIDTAHCIGFISTKTADHTGLVNWSLSHLTRALAHRKPTFGIRLGTGTTAGGGNSAGAAIVCTWRFGSSGAIPRASITGSEFLPAEVDARSLIERNELDCILVVGRMPPRIEDLLTTVHNPTTVIQVSDISTTLPEHKNSIYLGCASLSRSTEGDMLRSDGRLVTLRPFEKSRQPSIQEVLTRLLKSLVAETHCRSAQ